MATDRPALTREQRIRAWVDRQLTLMPPMTDAEIGRAVTVFADAHRKHRKPAA